MSRLIRHPYVIAVGAALALAVVPAAQGQDGSDLAFDQMLRKMTPDDTGSMWFNYYVERINMEIAEKQSVEAYGAAGPAGPTAGFDGYINNFIAPDSGSAWFNDYVDRVNFDLQEKARSAFY